MEAAGLLWQVVVSIAAVAAVYGGIRVDIRHMHRQIKEAKDSATEAHQRIDAALSCNVAGCSQNFNRRRGDKTWE